jgi:hypothetical protein
MGKLLIHIPVSIILCAISKETKLKGTGWLAQIPYTTVPLRKYAKSQVIVLDSCKIPSFL